MLVRQLLQRSLTMKTNAKTKLVLGRETLQRLDANTLDGVRGGAGDGQGGQGGQRQGPKDDPSCYIGPCCNGR